MEWGRSIDTRGWIYELNTVHRCFYVILYRDRRERERERFVSFFWEVISKGLWRKENCEGEGILRIVLNVCIFYIFLVNATNWSSWKKRKVDRWEKWENVIRSCEIGNFVEKRIGVKFSNLKKILLKKKKEIVIFDFEWIVEILIFRNFLWEFSKKRVLSRNRKSTKSKFHETTENP